MNESSEVAGENEQVPTDHDVVTAEIMRMLDEVGEAFEDAFTARRRFLPVRITAPAEWPRQLLN
jgi:hypothetical protein